MLNPLPTVRLEWVFRDRENRSGQMIIHLPFSTTSANLNTFISTMHALLVPLTDAVIVSVKYRYQLDEDAPGTAEVGSKAGYFWAVYYRNEERSETLYIPAPNQDYLETSGSYAGIRLDATLTAVSDALADLETALAACCTPEGDSFPTTFLAGGIVR